MVERFDDAPTNFDRAMQIWQVLVCKAHNRQTATYEMLSKCWGTRAAAP
jgi:hypothetical protein